MIARGKHHVTGLNQSVIECDTPDCTEAMYVMDGPATAAQRITDLGWQTTKRPHPQGLDEYNAHCPTHNNQDPIECHHPIARRAWIRAGYAICQPCGKRMDTA